MATTADWHIDVIAGTWINNKRPSKHRALHEGKQKARSRWLSQLQLGEGLQTKRENEKEGGSRLVRSLRIGLEDCRRPSPAWKLHVLSFSNSAFHLQPFIFFLICHPLLLPVSKCLLLLSPILYPFPALLTLSFPASLSISFFSLFFLSLWHWALILAFSSLYVPAHGFFYVHTDAFVHLLHFRSFT